MRRADRSPAAVTEVYRMLRLSSGVAIKEVRSNGAAPPRHIALCSTGYVSLLSHEFAHSSALAARRVVTLSEVEQTSTSFVSGRVAVRPVRRRSHL